MLRIHVSHQPLIAVVFGVKNQPLLQQLKLMHKEHQEDADHQRDKGRVEGNTQRLGYTRNVALNSAIRLSERITNIRPNGKAEHLPDSANTGPVHLPIAFDVRA